MTSLTGSSGEDFASILRSLGYRMDKRVKPAEPSPAPAEPAAPADATAGAVESTVGEAAVQAPVEAAEANALRRLPSRR